MNMLTLWMQNPAFINLSLRASVEVHRFAWTNLSLVAAVFDV